MHFQTVLQSLAYSDHMEFDSRLQSSSLLCITEPREVKNGSEVLQGNSEKKQVHFTKTCQICVPRSTRFFYLLM